VAQAATENTDPPAAKTDIADVYGFFHMASLR